MNPSMDQVEPEGTAFARDDQPWGKGQDQSDQLLLVTQELVESSNRALGQSNQKLVALETELADMQSRFEKVGGTLASERKMRMAAESQLAALLEISRGAEPAAAVEAITRADIQELLRRLDAAPAAAKAPAKAGGASGLFGMLLAMVAGGALGAALTLLTLPLWEAGRQTPKRLLPDTLNQPQSQLQAQKTGGSGSQLRPSSTAPPSTTAPARDILRLRCVQPCWLEVTELNSGKQLFFSMFKGSTSFPIGAGLEVFTGRGDQLKIRINDGQETPFSTRRVGKRTFLPVSR